MNIEITEKYKASLIPFPKETLKPLKLPTEIFEFLTETGLPLHAGYEITPNAPLTFFDMPYIKKHAHLQNTFLDIASMDMMGELTIEYENTGSLSNTKRACRQLGKLCGNTGFC